MIVAVIKPFMLSARRGADVSLYVATSPEVTNVSGQYFVKSKVVAASPLSREPRVMVDVWQWTEKTIGFGGED